MRRELWQQLTLQSSRDGQIAEFGKKFCGSYMLLSGEDFDSLPVYIKSDAGEDWHYAAFHPKFGDIPIVWSEADEDDDDMELKAFFPETGSFTFRGRYWVSSRIPERQYLKSVSEASYYPTEVLQSLVAPQRHNGLNTFKDGLARVDLFSSALNPEYYPLERRKLLGKEESGYAVDRDWGVTLHPLSNDKFLLWYRRSVVGEIIDNDIVVINTIMSQEVRDFARRQQFQGNIV